MSEALLTVNNLHAQFNQAGQAVKAVNGVSFQIKKGETFALVGESGSGKSVTALSVLRLLPNNAQITQGEVLYAGKDLLREPEHRMQKLRGARIAMIFQDPMVALNPVMSIGDQIAESIVTHQGTKVSNLTQRVIALIVKVGLTEPEQRLKQFPHQLSGGMQQRVLIAIALASEPDLLIADEPTTALDVTIEAQILQLLKELQRQNGMALWIITHDLGVVSEIADSVAVMYQGKLLEVAPAEQFFLKPAHPYSQSLFDALPSFEKRSQKLSRAIVGDHSEAIKVVPEPEQKLAGELEYKQETVLELKHVKVYFPIKKGLLKRTIGHVKAVDDISFKIEAGKTVALVGESGCGKSTLAKAILQLIPTTSGQVIYDQKDLTQLTDSQMRAYRSQIQIIFQDPFSSMNPRMLAGDILKEGMHSLRKELSKIEQHERCLELLQQVDLEADAMLRYPHEFSGGQRQRLCIARALAVNPSVIICDEPTSALDVSVQAQVLNLLKRLQRERGLAYLFISHDLSVVSYLADSVQVMYEGQIVESGSVEEVMKNPVHPYTQSLIKAAQHKQKNHD